MLLPFSPARRRPADPAFLARRLAAIAWHEPPSPRLRLVETCRAELEWAVAEWRWLSSDPDDSGRDWGPHPSEAWRLPHEHAAARVVNCHLHVDVAQFRLNALVPKLRDQRAAALRLDQGTSYRLYWADAATSTEGDVREYLRRRRLAWRCFRAASADYLHLKAMIDQGNFTLAA
jgi:hypothetical protein